MKRKSSYKNRRIEREFNRCKLELTKINNINDLIKLSEKIYDLPKWKQRVWKYLLFSYNIEINKFKEIVDIYCFEEAILKKAIFMGYNFIKKLELIFFIVNEDYEEELTITKSLTFKPFNFSKYYPEINKKRINKHKY